MSFVSSAALSNVNLALHNISTDVLFLARAVKMVRWGPELAKHHRLAC